MNVTELRSDLTTWNARSGASRTGTCSLVLTAILALPVSAADPGDDAEVLAGWIALDAPTGHEHWATESLLDRLGSGWNRDRSGNLVRTLGEGRPRHVVACALDAHAYAVTQITDDGYLRLHRLGRGSRDPLWDQVHAGNQLRVLTADGVRIGVTAVNNNHFSPQHRRETDIISADDLWLDVGAEDRQEAERLGIRLLDPVLRDAPPWWFEGWTVGPSAGARVGCAAVVAAAQAEVSGAGSTSYVLSTQQTFGWVGLGGALRHLAAVDQVTVVDRGADDFAVIEVDLEQREPREPLRSLAPVLGQVGSPPVYKLVPRVTDADQLVERIASADAANLLAALVSRIDPEAAVPPWVEAPARSEPAPLPAARDAAMLDEITDLLDPLAESYGIPGHEGPVRALVLEALPAWARERVQTDEIGNLWVEFGGRGDPAAEVTVFMAHLDEVGFAVDLIADDGTVTLARRGGTVAHAWEGQPALLQVDPGEGADSVAEPTMLRGVFLQRPDPADRHREKMEAWFGLDAAGLAAAGVVEGMGVTGHKLGHRVGTHRYTSRALDDRVGSSALILALRGIDPVQVAQPVIFAWSVQEENGLHGAGALAERFGLRTRRVYSVDTFVSSDTPLESPHFAYAPLGAGPVLRSAENSSMATPQELVRNRRIAAEAGIEVQVGLTQGGTDGTRFTHFGAPNAGLSWPGRYSHSPAEIADLRDVRELVDLIRALALAAPE